MLFALQQSSIDSQIFENCDFCLPHLHLMPPLWGPHRNIAMTFGMEKLKQHGYPTVKKVRIRLFVLTAFMNVTDRHLATS